MKRSAAVLFLCVFFSAALCARAQVAPSASGRHLVLQVGAEGSNFQPDYAGQGVAQTSPQRLDGLGVYVDARFQRWAQIEAQGRWLHWNEYAGITENTYMIGPRIPVVENWKGLTPYGKFLIGWGSGPFLTGRTTAWAYGGGVDYRLSRKFSLRCVDFEYQDWRVRPNLYPWGLSAGLSYRLF
jgi:opacity protein-like surface antigen